MRLIDADVLEAYGTTVPKNCNAEDYLCGAREVLEHIDAMPTVDAIPIEWIEHIIAEIGDDSPYRPAIKWLLLTYKMEKEE